ncbi:hypothetical protein [Vibrio crassostreae]|uniref:hypothetical protein n=1 Tax=Vibrio crassostreae TaxID=246167 RepID=UPI00104A34C7|nr:hypothetical protein [Vibrio crassostreae]TCN92603.1 hypothetical protein EDB51_12624 [Vibrio crassostreae]CAK1939264.1 LPS export ABC transporter periplasmic protein LptC [Vibrio crassostreae]CAK1950890.1 LPS export ABC transporter periplasmic protein LptC [Vibrio crassostreae]CAK1955791.1 LPS export ABC transporter periplasmic protein LptC [Vibrio crassostreae]CAK2718067.1 LPS export ABC transporter periplasmic protein LptC [Vibrio crassostreae]
MNKEKQIFIVVALLGILVGWLTTFIPKEHLKGHYLANTASVVNPPEKIIYNQASVNIEFKKNNSYELLYVSTKEAGFTSSGTYVVTQHDISLDETQHEQIIPDRDLSFYEKVMISEGAVLSSDAMTYIPLNDKELLLVTQRGMIHFCKKVACADLPAYSISEPDININ